MSPPVKHTRAYLESELFNQRERIEEYKREVERRDELIAGADHRNAELQAQAAGLREALAYALKAGDMYQELVLKQNRALEVRADLADQNSARWLASAAAHLERAEKAERERDNWKAEAEWTDRLRTQALTEMRERCAAVPGAVVAEFGMRPEWSVAQHIAAAIRALPLEEASACIHGTEDPAPCWLCDLRLEEGT